MTAKHTDSENETEDASTAGPRIAWTTPDVRAYYAEDVRGGAYYPATETLAIYYS